MLESRSSKVRITATVHRLQINKNIRFQTKISWKRHSNKAQTTPVSHEHGYSTFQQALTLDFNLQYNTTTQLFQAKNTEIVAIIMYEDKVKSGGYAKYDIAQVVNNNLDSKLIKIPLTQCPDPNANVQITFSYEYVGEMDALSVLNASSRDYQLSRIDFHDDKLSLQMGRINDTINKLAQLAQSAKLKKGNQKASEMIIRVQQLQGENSTLKQNVARLEGKLEQRERQQGERLKSDQRTIKDLQKQLQKRSSEVRSKEMIEWDEQKRLKEQVIAKEKEVAKFKMLYQKTQLQVEGYRAGTSSSISVEPAPSKSQQRQLMTLRQQNAQLQSKVANQSFKIAQLFNAAFELGGGNLLDKLQTAIGLTEN